MTIKTRHVPLKPTKVCILAGYFYFNIMNIDLLDAFYYDFKWILDQMKEINAH